MSEKRISRGELSIPSPVSSTILEPLHGPGMVMNVRPVGMPPTSSSVSPMSLMRALKRRLSMAIGLAILTTSLAGPAAWLLIPAKYRAHSLLNVKSRAPQVIAKVDYQSGDEYKRYQKTQLSLLKSRQVLGPALTSSEISNLETIRNEKDKLQWLHRQTRRHFAT
jgi:uncharacterized protein involved in exopolysaccharide biosynthesis